MIRIYHIKGQIANGVNIQTFNFLTKSIQRMSMRVTRVYHPLAFVAPKRRSVFTYMNLVVNGNNMHWIIQFKNAMSGAGAKLWPVFVIV